MSVDTPLNSGPNSSRLAILLPFGVVTLIWGSTWLVIRHQLAVVPPSWSVTYRFVIAGVAMLCYALYKRETIVLDARGWAFAAVLGLCQFCLNFNFVYRAEGYVTSGLVAVVFALLLLPNAVLARLFLEQKLGRQLIVGMGVAMAGVVLLFVREARVDPHGPGQVLMGIGFTLLAVLSASIANVMQATPTARAYPMIPTVGVAMLIGAGIDGTIAWMLDGPPVFDPSPGYFAGLLYLGIAASALAFPLYFGVLRVIGPAKAAYSSVLVPVIAMALSTLFEHYVWTWLAAGGAGLVLGGLVIALRARRPAR